MNFISYFRADLPDFIFDSSLDIDISSYFDEVPVTLNFKTITIF